LPATARRLGAFPIGQELVGAPESRLNISRLKDHHDLPGSVDLADASHARGDQIMETLRVHKGMSGEQAARRAIETLELVRIPEAKRRMRQYPHELSGGMRQRIMIAMATACGRTC